MIIWNEYVRVLVPGEPVPKARARAVATKKGIRHYTPDKTKLFEKKIKVLAQKYRRVQAPKRTPVRFHLIAVFERPKYMMTAKYDDGLIEHTVRPDLDNVLKACKDALNGLAYHDDGQVCQIRAEAYWAEKDPNKARTEVVLYVPKEGE